MIYGSTRFQILTPEMEMDLEKEATINKAKQVMRNVAHISYELAVEILKILN